MEKYFIYAVLAGIAVYALARFVRFVVAKKKIYDLAHQKKPHEIAYEKLEALRKKNYVGDGLVKQYYYELSNIIRYYLEERFNVRAPEMTTEEFLVTLRENKEFNVEIKNLLREFLGQCDLVKFAKYGPTTSDVDRSYDSAKKVVDGTKPADIDEDEKKAKV